MIERRATTASVDEQKFSTQRLVTYVVLLIFTAVTTNVLIGQDQAERSTIIQTCINFTMLALGFWLGTSKQGQDQAQSVSKIAESAAPTTALAVAAARTEPLPPVPVAATIKGEDVKVEAAGDVTVERKT